MSNLCFFRSFSLQMSYVPELRLSQEVKAVKEHNHCSNCLSHSHSHRHCTSAHNCHHCGGRHHSLLHRNKHSSRSSSPTSATVAQSSHSNTQTSSASDSENTAVLHLNTPPAEILSRMILANVVPELFSILGYLSLL